MQNKYPIFKAENKYSIFKAERFDFLFDCHGWTQERLKHFNNHLECYVILIKWHRLHFNERKWNRKNLIVHAGEVITWYNK